MVELPRELPRTPRLSVCGLNHRAEVVLVSIGPVHCLGGMPPRVPFTAYWLCATIKKFMNVCCIICNEGGEARMCKSTGFRGDDPFQRSPLQYE